MNWFIFIFWKAGDIYQRHYFARRFLLYHHLYIYIYQIALAIIYFSKQILYKHTLYHLNSYEHHLDILNSQYLKHLPLLFNCWLVNHIKNWIVWSLALLGLGVNRVGREVCISYLFVAGLCTYIPPPLICNSAIISHWLQSM